MEPDDSGPAGGPTDSPAEIPAVRRRHGRRRAVWALLAAVAVAALVRPSPYAALVPGPAPAVRVGDGAPTGLHYTTVAVERLSWGRWLWRSLHGEQDPASAASRPDDARRAALEMVASKDAAWAASGALVGRPGAGRVLVTAVDAGSPAARAGLRPGDAVTAAGGAPVVAPAQLAAAVDRSQGRPLHLDVVRAGRRRAVQVRAARAPGPPPSWRLGVALAASGDPAGRSTLTTSGVGGPSAGLVFALAYAGARTGTDLAAAGPVAGTGTVDAEGRVGPVGAVAFKVVAAHRAGAKVFLVPSAEAGDAASAAPAGMRVVAVDDLASAVRWLCGHGGRGPVCTRDANDGRG